MSQPAYRCGMTLVEVMMTVVIIGMLAAILIPSVNLAISSRENAQCARKLHAAIEAFELYRSETGGYPPDQIVPAEMGVADMTAYYFPYYKIDWWGAATELGGRWDWDVGYHGYNFSVSIWCPTKSEEQMKDFDKLIDDGNLNTGNFRQRESQYHYILED